MTFYFRKSYKASDARASCSEKDFLFSFLLFHFFLLALWGYWEKLLSLHTVVHQSVKKI